MTTLTPEEILFLLNEVEAEDPIDFGDLPFDEEALRKLAALNVVEFLQSSAYADLGEEDREKIIAASMARLVLENMVLHARLLTRDGA